MRRPARWANESGRGAVCGQNNRNVGRTPVPTLAPSGRGRLGLDAPGLRRTRGQDDTSGVSDSVELRRLPDRTGHKSIPVTVCPQGQRGGRGKLFPREAKRFPRAAWRAGTSSSRWPARGCYVARLSRAQRPRRVSHRATPPIVYWQPPRSCLAAVRRASASPPWGRRGARST